MEPVATEAAHPAARAGKAAGRPAAVSLAPAGFQVLLARLPAAVRVEKLRTRPALGAAGAAGAVSMAVVVEAAVAKAVVEAAAVLGSQKILVPELNQAGEWATGWWS